MLSFRNLTIKVLNSKIIKFGVVGFIGTILNFITYKIITELLDGAYSIAAIIAFVVAVTNNYFLNHIWTFKRDVADKKPSFKMYLQYIIVNLIGLGVNLIVLNFVVYFFGFEFNFIGQAAGIVVGMIFNFIFSNYFVFKTKQGSND